MRRHAKRYWTRVDKSGLGVGPRKVELGKQPLEIQQPVRDSFRKALDGSRLFA